MRAETLRTLPGPAAYTLPPVFGYENHDITRRRNPAYTIGMKNTESVKLCPDPCYIKPGQKLVKKTNVPAHSMEGKILKRNPDRTPGPASYYPERCPVMREERPPAYTIGVRRRDPMPKPTPGPNTYHIPSYFGCKIPNKRSAPMYTIRGRPREHEGFKPPGPTTYTLPKLDVYKTRSPRHTITGRT
jgi:hypothetical protein